MNRRGFLKGILGVIAATTAPTILVGQEFKWNAASELFTPDEDLDIVARDYNRLLGFMARKMVETSPYLQMINGGKFPVDFSFR
jgi:hypothetical protein